MRRPTTAAGAPPSATAPASGKPAPAATRPSPAATRVTPRAGWLLIDPAAWDAQVAKCRATEAQPAGAAGNLPEFRADCRYSH